MRLAVFGDIHGNLPALSAALNDMRIQGADALVCVGDVAADGPWPGECVRRVAQLGCPVVRGNADRMLLEPPVPFESRGLPNEREMHDIGAWSADQLTSADRALLETYQPTVDLGDVLCFHGSPARDSEVIGAHTPAARLDELRREFGTQAVWVGGHTHTALARELDGWQLLNPGSVGLPFEKRGDTYVNLAHAEYVLLDDDGGRWTPVFRRVPYDVEDIRRGVLASGMPHARWAASEWVAGHSG
ncbi:putative phosphoesterase [Deinococcus metalli]|uniref:Phosphoesterase n=1 Tax=Deinococcus metalli TaxID=1141878 RepID=A0A7W8KCN3_9DEIO|nr:metallophosphoesterase family protein [Deinococcus metalli]MBB5375495.1 putative phosphoesterase [Deinococcus metalli]GHF28841.1 phosphoesterase [Deinococcus metalli]